MNNQRNAQSARLPAVGRLQTQESGVLKGNPAKWIAQFQSNPLLRTVCDAGRKARAEKRPNEVFFRHYLQFFREATLLELPYSDDWITEWLALAFESAFDLARQDRSKAEDWLDNAPLERNEAERIFDLIARHGINPCGSGYRFTRGMVSIWEDLRAEYPSSLTRESWLLQSVERFFWTGLYAATVVPPDLATGELLSWLESKSAHSWNDLRHHINIIRKSPLQSDRPIKDSLAHPLLRIADDKYGSSPLERAVVKEFLESQCIKHNFTSEKDCVGSDLILGAWVRDAWGFSNRLQRKNPAFVDRIVQTPGLLSREQLRMFYEYILSGIKDKTDPIALTSAFLVWCGDLRKWPVSRYYGEQLSTVLICVDAALWLPWTYRKKGYRRETAQ